MVEEAPATHVARLRVGTWRVASAWVGRGEGTRGGVVHVEAGAVIVDNDSAGSQVGALGAHDTMTAVPGMDVPESVIVIAIAVDGKEPGCWL